MALTHLFNAQGQLDLFHIRTDESRKRVEVDGLSDRSRHASSDIDEVKAGFAFIIFLWGR